MVLSCVPVSLLHDFSHYSILCLHLPLFLPFSFPLCFFPRLGFFLVRFRCAGCPASSPFLFCSCLELAGLFHIFVLLGSLPAFSPFVAWLCGLLISPVLHDFLSVFLHVALPLYEVFPPRLICCEVFLCCPSLSPFFVHLDSRVVSALLRVPPLLFVVFHLFVVIYSQVACLMGSLCGRVFSLHSVASCFSELPFTFVLRMCCVSISLLLSSFSGVSVVVPVCWGWVFGLAFASGSTVALLCALSCPASWSPLLSRHHLWHIFLRSWLCLETLWWWVVAPDLLSYLPY